MTHRGDGSGEPGLRAVDKLEMHVLVDNVTDSLSSMPGNVTNV